MKSKIIQVQKVKVNITNVNDNDYICISDFTKFKEGKSTSDDVIKNWLRNRITLEFLGTWESIYNPNFNSVEFDGFKNQAGLHTFTLSVSQWCEKTNAIGIYSKRGKYGGTYAHKDIAFEFASAISPVFKLYLIKEFERLKELENQNREWDVKRILTKNNYLIHTDAIKNYILPDNNYYKNKEWLKYAEEADILNVALFNTTAKKWRELNPYLAKMSNVRDYASINELTVLSNLESHNSELIKEGKSKEERFEILKEIAKYQLDILNNAEKIKLLEEGKDMNIKEIIDINQKRVSKDLQEINGIKGIDFIDIFPISEEHRGKLKQEAKNISTLIDSTEKGDFYLLNNSIKTKWGDLKFLKIRFYDESKLNYEAVPDFEIENWDKLKEKCKCDVRFKFIEREKWNAIEFKTDNCLVYFLNPLLTEVYGI